MPDSGFHSVIDRPALVRRVEPPTTTMANTMAATTNSQMATGRAGPDFRNEVMFDQGFQQGTTAKPYCRLPGLVHPRHAAVKNDVLGLTDARFPGQA